MKKLAAKRRNPVRRKPAKARKVHLDIDTIRQLLLAERIEADSLEDMIEDLIDAPLDDPDGGLELETLAEISNALCETRVDANGGAHEARETLKWVSAIIDEAAQQDEIAPATLMLLGRLFAGAQLDVGEAARASMGRFLKAAQSGQAGKRLPSLLQTMPPAAVEDPFSLFEGFSSQIAIFPTNYKAEAVETLAIERNALGSRIAVGFLLHPDEPVALAAVRGLGAAAAGGALEPESRRRVETIRPWLAPVRRAALDAAMPAGATGARSRPVKLVKALASACDGSGASTLSVIAANGSRYLVASAMIKQKGVAEALLIEDLAKQEATSFGQEMDRAAPTAEISFATLSKLLGLALGRNLVNGAPPPFSLVQFLEALGLDCPVPDLATTTELIDTTVAEIAGGADDKAIGEAHAFMLKNEIAQGWFEAGDAVDAILDDARTPTEAVGMLLEAYLPKRRAFWASQCALSSLALKDSASRGESWKKLALVGRDILRDVPVNDIPLMQRIANRSALAYFMQS